MQTSIKPKSSVPTCAIGCPAEIRYELSADWDCTNNGMPDINCTDWVKVLLEVQPYQAGTGERSSCSVEGISVDIAYRFWFEPQDNYHLVTPNSSFATNTFDAALLGDAKSIVKWLGQEWLVWELQNWVGGCFNDTREEMGIPVSPCEEPTSNCGIITIQTGLLVPYAACKKDTIPSEPEYCPDDSGWVKVGQLYLCNQSSDISTPSTASTPLS